jgi:hypothetical protein
LSYTTFIDFSSLDTILARKVVSFQRLANGITATPDLSQIFIAESGRRIWGLLSQPSGQFLHFDKFVRINGHTDNLHFVAKDYLSPASWGQSFVMAGVHPNILSLRRSAKGGTAPSWIVSVRPGNETLEEKVTGYIMQRNMERNGR